MGVRFETPGQQTGRGVHLATRTVPRWIGDEEASTVADSSFWEALIRDESTHSNKLRPQPDQLGDLLMWVAH